MAINLLPISDEIWIKCKNPDCLKDLLKLARKYQDVTFYYNGYSLSHWVEEQIEKERKEAEEIEPS